MRPNADYLKLVDGFEADEAGLDYFRRPVSLETIPVNKGPWDDLWIKVSPRSERSESSSEEY